MEKWCGAYLCRVLVDKQLSIEKEQRRRKMLRNQGHQRFWRSALAPHGFRTVGRRNLLCEEQSLSC